MGISRKKGFSHKIDRDRLLEFSKMSIEGRLKWLEEANQFLASITNKDIKEKWKLFRKIKFEAN